MIIYSILNKLNGKMYVGQTIRSIKIRWKQHTLTGNALYNAIKKYGKENFIITTIDSALTKEELNNKEIYWIKELNTYFPNGYNLTFGGESPFGFKHSEEFKNKKRLSFSGKSNPNFGKYMRGSNNPSFGLKRSEETKAKLKLARNKRPRTGNARNQYTFAVYKDNQLLGTWLNQRKCAESLNIDYKVVNHCLNNKPLSYVEYRFIKEIR